MLTLAAHGASCEIHPSPERIHVGSGLLDSALLSALSFHVIRKMQRFAEFNDTIIVNEFEPGWLTAHDISEFGAVVEVEVDPADLIVHDRRPDGCVCVEAGDSYLIKPAAVTRAWSHRHLFNSLNGDSLAKLYQGWIATTSFPQARRMNDGMYLMEFRPQSLLRHCPVADRKLSRLRAKYRALDKHI